MTKAEEQERLKAIETLRAWIGERRDVCTVLAHVTKSGMSRSIKVLLPVNGDGVPEVSDVSWLVARVLCWPFDRTYGGIKVDGCGMDMGHHLVYELSSVLYREPDGKFSHEGSYRLKQRWI